MADAPPPSTFLCYPPSLPIRPSWRTRQARQVVGIIPLEKTAGAIPGSPTNLVPDNWIYIQEPGVRVGRLQFFNNWSPYMVRDPNTVWVGMEYFCSEGDDLWTMPESAAVSLGIAELEKIGFAKPESLIDSVVIRVPKAYPGYYGS